MIVLSETLRAYLSTNYLRTYGTTSSAGRAATLSYFVSSCRTMYRSAILLPLLLGAASAFAPSALPQQSAVASSSALFAGELDRRDALTKAAQLTIGGAGISLSTFGFPSLAKAGGTPKVVVAGATGQTGVSYLMLYVLHIYIYLFF